MSWAVFLDRDGTLLQDRPYICRFRDAELFPFSTAAIRALNRLGCLTVIVTNQSAVARGLCTVRQINSLHRRLRAHLIRQGARIDAVYYSPYLPEGVIQRYSKEHESRKPRPGLLLAAAADLAIDLGRSFMIGDSPADIEAGKRAGCRTILVQTGRGQRSEEELRGSPWQPDMVAENILAAAEAIATLMPAGQH